MRLDWPPRGGGGRITEPQNGAALPATYITRPLTLRAAQGSLLHRRAGRGGAIGGSVGQSEGGGAGRPPIGSRAGGGRGGRREVGVRAGRPGPPPARQGEGNLPPFFNPPARARRHRADPAAAAAMAPLLGRKPFPLAKPLPPGEPGERFIIPHTQEAFRTREYPHGRGGRRGEERGGRLPGSGCGGSSGRSGRAGPRGTKGRAVLVGRCGARGRAAFLRGLGVPAPPAQGRGLGPRRGWGARSSGQFRRSVCN